METTTLSANALNWLLSMYDLYQESKAWEKLSDIEKELFKPLREKNIKNAQELYITTTKTEVYELVLENLPMPFTLKSALGEFLFVNKAYEQAFDIDRKNILNDKMHTLEFLSEKELLKLQIDNAVALDTLCTMHKTFSFENDPKKRNFLYWLSAFQNKDNHRFAFTLMHDITNFSEKESTLIQKLANLESTNESIIKQSTLDPLTGAYNRSAMPKFFQQTFKEAQMLKKTFSVLLIDIDHFKKVNDTFGHLIGDQILQLLVMLLKNVVRDADKIIRFGGEEFLVLLPNTDLTAAQAVASRMRLTACENMTTPDNKPVTISIGIATYSNQEYPEQLIQIADENLYKAKASGRNCVVPSSSCLTQQNN